MFDDSMRSNFSKRTIDTLGKRVAFICSNPQCSKLTIGPSKENKLKSTTIGIAAHIRAAALGGPRFDGSMSLEERASIDNGIWLCGNCSILIDKEWETYTPELLLHWKKSTEEKIRREFEQSVAKIKQLNLEHTGFNNASILVRKKFNTNELIELLGFIGLKHEIKNLNDPKSLSIALYDLAFYDVSDYPKLIVFETADRKVEIGLIKSITFSKKKNFPIGITKNPLRVFFPNVIRFLHNEKQYQLKFIDRPNTFPFSAKISGPDSLVEEITPILLLTVVPLSLTISSTEVLIEIPVLDWVLANFMKKGEVIYWEVELTLIKAMKKNIIKSLNIKQEALYIWKLTAFVAKDVLVDVYFTRDEHNNILGIPLSRHKIIYNTLKEFSQVNYEVLLTHGLISRVLEYLRSRNS